MADLGRFKIASHILSIKIINEENIIRIKTKVSVGNSKPPAHPVYISCSFSIREKL
jgi:hypothetical protein